MNRETFLEKINKIKEDNKDKTVEDAVEDILRLLENDYYVIPTNAEGVEPMVGKIFLLDIAEDLSKMTDR